MASELNLTTEDWLTLYAFLQMLEELDQPLPSETISQINQRGRDLSNGDRDAVNQLYNIASQHPLLKEKYKILNRQVLAKYQPQELPIPRQRPEALAEMKRILDNVVLPSLTDPDPQTAAKTRLQKIKDIFPFFRKKN